MTRLHRVFVAAFVSSLSAGWAAAGAQPPGTPYAESGSFVLNTNRIGYADSSPLVVTGVPDDPGVLATVRLGIPLPNPFSRRVTIPFAAGKHGLVELTIFDLRGRRVRTLTSMEFGVGSYTRQGDGRNDRGLVMAAGVYLVRIKLGEAVETRKITLVR
jgi:hypothetical protein